MLKDHITEATVQLSAVQRAVYPWHQFSSNGPMVGVKQGGPHLLELTQTQKSTWYT